jgi:PIN domain nuclease of toxin-antitoxin system
VTRALLDTHAFMWWIEASPRIKPEWIELILDPENEILVSAVSGFEMETKRRIGKLEFDYDVAEKIAEHEFASLPVGVSHAVLAGAIEWNHRDPFDRLLIGQAVSEGLVLVSADAAMTSAPGVRVL